MELKLLLTAPQINLKAEGDVSRGVTSPIRLPSLKPMPSQVTSPSLRQKPLGWAFWFHGVKLH
ncbi:MAG: hypothetical protein GH156_03180 [Dehalococcoidia bacterium]|nr:hypothetical protein [Dehalococcoidia bacterium]